MLVCGTQELRGLSKAQLGKLLGISDSLAALNHGRFKTFRHGQLPLPCCYAHRCACHH